MWATAGFGSRWAGFGSQPAGFSSLLLTLCQPRAGGCIALPALGWQQQSYLLIGGLLWAMVEDWRNFCEHCCGLVYLLSADCHGQQPTDGGPLISWWLRVNVCNLWTGVAMSLLCGLVLASIWVLADPWWMLHSIHLWLTAAGRWSIPGWPLKAKHCGSMSLPCWLVLQCLYFVGWCWQTFGIVIWKFKYLLL